MEESEDEKSGHCHRKIKTFKLYFPPTIPPGKSNIQIDRPLKQINLITEKFYRTDEVDTTIPEEVIKEKMKELETSGPREKYKKAMTENQKYGWYQVKLTDLDKSDRRIYFGIQKKKFIDEHLMNYAKIRDY